MKKKQNNFDLFVERLAEEFSKIPNFDLTQKDEVGNRIFNLIVFRITEISSYKDLIVQHFIPATNRVIVDGKNSIQKSKYKTFVNTEEIDFRETLYDTIRLAYVGLFHKLENFVNDIIKIPVLLFDEELGNGESILKWAKRNYDFDFKDWQQFYITHKLNWICICVKHYDGFPLKEPKPFAQHHFPVDKRISLEPQEFKKDCELLIEFYPLFIRTTFLLAQARIVLEETSENEDLELVKLKTNIDLQVRKYLNLLKDLK